MNNSKKLAWQQGSAALYAEIDLEVTIVDNQLFRVIIPEGVQPKWSDAIRFAAHLFVECYAWKNPQLANATIAVNEIKTVSSDTTVCSLAYVTFQALCSACRLDGEEKFSFNRILGSFAINQRESGISDV